MEKFFIFIFHFTERTYETVPRMEFFLSRKNRRQEQLKRVDNHLSQATDYSIYMMRNYWHERDLR